MNARYLAHCIRHPVKAYREKNNEEKVICRKNGKNAENTYYMIRCDLPECGFFAIYTYILDHLCYANDHGYIPVLDIERYNTLYKEDSPINGKTNPWNYYFENISDVKPKDCSEYANVIKSVVAFPHYKAIYYYADKEKNTLPDFSRIHELNAIVKQYIHFNSETELYLTECVNALLGKETVLGIHVRGTDMYREGKQHPIPTGDTKDFSKIDEIIEKHNITRILLCTDTEETVHLFREKYGDKLVTTQSIRQKDNSCTGIHKDWSLATREHHKYKMGLEVLTDMYLLSKCSVLVCGPSNVPFTSVIYNDNKYEAVYYYA